MKTIQLPVHHRPVIRVLLMIAATFVLSALLTWLGMEILLRIFPSALNPDRPF